MSFTIDITNWQKTSVFNEIVEALNERLVAVGDEPIPVLPDYADIQALSVWTVLQQKVELLALKYLFSSADYSSVSSDIASFRAAAGLNEGGFRRMTSEGIGTYGTAQAYDIMGSWLWEDLIKGLKALTTISASYLSLNPVDSTIYASVATNRFTAFYNVALWVDDNLIESSVQAITDSAYNYSTVVKSEGFPYADTTPTFGLSIGKDYTDLRGNVIQTVGDSYTITATIRHNGIVPVAFVYSPSSTSSPYSEAKATLSGKTLTITKTWTPADGNATTPFVSPHKITYGIRPAFRYT
jgi:hypothetical protein